MDTIAIHVDGLLLMYVAIGTNQKKNFLNMIGGNIVLIKHVKIMEVKESFNLHQNGLFMTKVAIVNDLHIGVKNDASILLDHQEKFFTDIFFPYVDNNGIRTVINLGDSWDRRRYINFGTLVRGKKMFFDPLAERGIYSPTIVGNHDAHYKNHIKVNSMNELIRDNSKYSNVHVIDEPEVINIEGFKICMIPWICDENYDRCINLIKNPTTDICMGHFNIAGFVMHVGQVSQDGLDREMFDHFDMVLSGHFHHKSTDGIITYLGTQYEMTWHDYNDPKGFHILDLETRELQFIRNPYKMHHRIVYHEGIELDFTKYKDVNVKVVVDKKVDSKKYDLFMSMLYEANPYTINVVENHIDVNEVSEEIKLDESIGTLSLLHTYLDHATMAQDIDMNRLKSIFNDIYMESQQINVEE